MAKTKKMVVAELALLHFEMETLEERKSDRLDFKTTSVWDVKAALEKAYEAGRAAAKGGA